MNLALGFGLQKAALGTLLTPPAQQDLFLPTGTIVTKDGNMIVMTGDNNFILTVDGFQPLELLMSGGLPLMSNENIIQKT